ncbi:MAG: hypothetical protein ABR520_04690 [Mycobacteriales bacterium]|nr:hypothetical protein [Frankia sp.]
MRDDVRYELATLVGWGAGLLLMAVAERVIASRAVVSYAERLCREAARERA